jgi:hypothetical protein
MDINLLYTYNNNTNDINSSDEQDSQSDDNNIIMRTPEWIPDNINNNINEDYFTNSTEADNINNNINEDYFTNSTEADNINNNINEDYFTNSTADNHPEIYNNNAIGEYILLDEYSNLFNFMIQRRSDLIENNYTEDEIIKILKIYLITQYIPLNHISYILFKFYEYYNIDNITYDNIIDILDNNRNNIIQPQIEIINNIYTLNYAHNQIVNVINSLLEITEPIDFNDVVIATDSNTLEELNKYTLDTNLDTQCVICMEKLNETQVVCELPCKHLFHDECIKEHLTYYSYKCPICRDEVGPSVPLL